MGQLTRSVQLFSALFSLGLFICIAADVLAQPSTVSKSNNTIVQTMMTARFEHIAFNVPDPVALAKWYTDNLGMKVMRSGPAPTFTTFIADSGRHMMLELTHNASFPLFDPEKIHFTSLHLAYSTPDIKQVQDQLTAAGARIVDSLRTTASGDVVITLRDPWGLAIQCVQRVKPMLSFSGVYPEHFAMNVEDSRAKARWYLDHLGMAVLRDGKAPSYGMFIADAGRNMMYELYQNKEVPVVDFSAISPMSFHVAYSVNDIQAVKDALVAAGATLVDDITTIPSGDKVLMLRDPWNQPIQFVKRVYPMIQ